MHAETVVHEEGRPTTEVIGTPLPLQPAVRPASDAKGESNDADAKPATPRPRSGFFLEADLAIDTVEDAGNDLAVATFRETRLYDGRALEKSAAIVRLMATNNPETSKLHSASSAEKVVESDARYMTYRDSERAAVVERIQAEATLSAAKLRARLAVVLAEANV